MDTESFGQHCRPSACRSRLIDRIARDMIRLLLTIVICAGMNALLPHHGSVGETRFVNGGVTACELFNGYAD